jgi:diguanylate cyclase
VLLDSLALLLAATVATWWRGARAWRAAAASLGLLLASSTAVHISGGLIEMHFHFFVVVAIITLYQHWRPFLLAIAYVVLDHGVVGALRPAEVYNHPAAWERPWLWAIIHGAFVVAASAAQLAQWHLSEYQGLHDPLTRLANRVLFRDRLARALARRGALAPYPAVIFLDLDGFKPINDSRGHDAGDQVLRAVADRLRANARAEDTVARFGGDEFALLLASVPDEAAAREIAERLLLAVRAPVAYHDREVVVRASIGIVVAGPGWDDVSAVLRGADIAMYVAKGRGGSSVVLHEPRLHAALLERQALQADLHQAIEADQFVLLFQPTVDLATDALVGVEALVRWRHPRHGLIAPATFIPLAEETGLIVPLGHWVLDRACTRLADWRRRYPERAPTRVSVNLSARQLQEPGLAAVIAATLARADLTPDRLVLEITERALVEEPEQARQHLQSLKATGVGIAVQDFGTGYASLSYLRNPLIDTIKIDKSFIDDLTVGSPHAALVRTIVELGRTLQLHTVAEGIEDPHQRAMLAALGCELGQGYHLAHPLDEAEMDTLLGGRGETSETAA